MHGFDLKMTDKKFNFAEKNQLDKTDRYIKKNMSPCLFKLGTSRAELYPLCEIDEYLKMAL